MPREETKINIIVKGDRVFMGVQATDCDPKMTTLQGGLPAAIERLPSFIVEANQQWDVAPKNPKSTIPEPVKPVVKPVTTSHVSTGKPTAAKPAAPAQQGFF
jgi:hypothetical protein